MYGFTAKSSTAPLNICQILMALTIFQYLVVRVHIPSHVQNSNGNPFLLTSVQKSSCSHFIECNNEIAFFVLIFALFFVKTIYRTRAIITRGLYTFYPLFEVQKTFFQGAFFLKF